MIWAQDLYTTGEGLVVKQGSHIDSLAALKGHKVALAQGSSSSFELAVAEKQAAVAAGAINVVNMTPPAMLAAWKRGDIQAAYVWVPFFSEMQSDGGKAVLFDQSQGAAAPIFNLAVVNSKFAAAHQGVVQGFVRAEQAGVAFMEQHPQQA